MQKGEALQIIDHGSPNGTYLNGQKLIKEEARILRDGDDIRLGHLAIRITFNRAQSAAS
jgi:pSer/pThr/pTyr-binding forkhead associated (FHA) protein